MLTDTRKCHRRPSRGALSRRGEATGRGGGAGLLGRALRAPAGLGGVPTESEGEAPGPAVILILRVNPYTPSSRKGNGRSKDSALEGFQEIPDQAVNQPAFEEFRGSREADPTPRCGPEERPQGRATHSPLPLPAAFVPKMPTSSLYGKCLPPGSKRARQTECSGSRRIPAGPQVHAE